VPLIERQLDDKKREKGQRIGGIGSERRGKGTAPRGVPSSIVAAAFLCNSGDGRRRGVALVGGAVPLRFDPDVTLTLWIATERHKGDSGKPLTAFTRWLSHGDLSEVDIPHAETIPD